MRSSTKSIIAAIFIIVASMPFTFSVYFLAQQQIIHFNASKAFEEHSLQTLRIVKDGFCRWSGDQTAAAPFCLLTNGDVVWINERKELLIDGKLFDVKNIRDRGNYFEVTGLFDGKEDELNRQLKKMEQEKSPANSRVNNTLITFLFQTLFSNTTAVNTNTLIQTRNYNFSNAEDLYSIDTSIKSPPPKVI